MYEVNESEFRIEKTYDSESISLFEAFVFQLFEIAQWTLNTSGEYPSEISFTISPSVTLFGKLFVKECIELLNSTNESKNKKLKLTLNGFYTAGLSAITN